MRMRDVLQRATLVGFGLLLAVLVLILTEASLRLLGVGEEGSRYDPFAGFSRSVPMFELGVDEAGEPVYRTVAARGLREERTFAAQKTPGAFRVFVVGESSAAGVPYGVEWAFSAFLEKRLRARLPSVPVEVVNAAVSGYASRRILSVVEEIARYEPDLLVVYTGHNEFAESRYYAHLVGMDPRLFGLMEWFAQTRLYRVANQAGLLGDAQQGRPRLDFNEIDNSTQMFAIATKHLEGAYPSARELAWGEEHYRLNLEKMIDAMDAVGAEVVLVTLGQDFADWAPAASSHRDGLSASDLAAFERSVQAGDEIADTDPEGALRHYRQALRIDDTYADLHFKVADAERRRKDFAAAREEYRRASDLDRVPHGAPTRFNEILKEIARERGTLLVDADVAFEKHSPDGMVGQSLFVDLVHPNLVANELIAAVIAEELRAAGIPLPAKDWRDDDEPPGVELLYAGDPQLRIRENLGRGVACLLSRREPCARQAIDAVLAIDPRQRDALDMAAAMRKRAALAASAPAP